MQTNWNQSKPNPRVGVDQPNLAQPSPMRSKASRARAIARQLSDVLRRNARGIDIDGH